MTDQTKEPTKVCTKCKKELPLSAFNEHKTTIGYKKMCIECTRKDAKIKAKRTPLNIAEEYDPLLRNY